jgi:hypothetical protein
MKKIRAIEDSGINSPRLPKLYVALYEGLTLYLHVCPIADAMDY